MKVHFLLMALAIGNRCFSQDIPLSTQQQLEQMAEIASNEIENEALVQQLEYFKRHPVCLNTAVKEDLLALHLLTELQILYFIQYRKVIGKFIDLHELQAIPGWDVFLIHRLLPYVTLKEPVSWSDNIRSRLQGEHSFLFRAARILEKSKGFDTQTQNGYLGDRQHLLVRYRYQFKDLLWAGMTGEKDAGEQFFRGAQSKGFDFYSFHLFLRNLGIVKSLALGDFMVNLGQGLISWQSTGFGKSAEVLAIKRSSPVLLPYRASGEFGFYRGAGCTINKKNLEATVFVSMKKINASVDDSSGTFTGINNSGYNRTITEVEKKNQITQFTSGGRVGFSSTLFRMGFNAMVHRFNVPMVFNGVPYSSYGVTGKQMMHGSLDAAVTFRNMHFFGEAAADEAYHYAFVAGALVTPDPTIDLSFVYRSIPMNFRSLFGNIFSENAVPMNEKGVYAGLSVRPFPTWQFNAYLDLFQFPWLRFRVNAPSKGHDYMAQVSYQPNKQVGLYVRYKNKDKPLNGPSEQVIRFPVAQQLQNVRIHFTNQINARLLYKTRVEVVWYTENRSKSEQGFLGYLEVEEKAHETLKVGFRAQYFETSGFATRVYAYEPDVLYSFSIPAFYDKGFRFLLHLQYQLTKHVTLWIRYARSNYKDTARIGSGLDTIYGHFKSEIKFQLQILL